MHSVLVNGKCYGIYVVFSAAKGNYIGHAIMAENPRKEATTNFCKQSMIPWYSGVQCNENTNPLAEQSWINAPCN